MAKIFLDTNYLIDALHRKPEKEILASLEHNIVYISPLSVHIYCYIFKLKMPNKAVHAQIEKFQLVELSEGIVMRALQGPTGDFEDNIQLHSAADAECQIFLTEDRKILSMKFFGKMILAQKLE
jgi:predicted nucleic acid-binding protein